MTEKRLFWRQFWLLWGAGVIIGAIVAALVRIPTTPLAALLLLRNHSQKPVLLGVEAIEITIELAIAVSCGLFAARRVGLGAPILEKWLRGEKIKSQLRSLLVPTFLVGILIAVVSMLPSLSVFHPNRQLAHQEAQRISESPDGAKLAERLGRFVDDRPLSLPSLTVWYLNAEIRGELIFNEGNVARSFFAMADWSVKSLGISIGSSGPRLNSSEHCCLSAATHSIVKTWSRRLISNTAFTEGVNSTRRNSIPISRDFLSNSTNAANPDESIERTFLISTINFLAV